MNEKSFKRKFEFQKNMILRQSEQIEELKSQNEKLKLELDEKEKIINSIDSLRNELIKNVEDTKQYKKEYGELINELRKMKKIIDKEVYKGRWKLVKFLIR